MDPMCTPNLQGHIPLYYINHNFVAGKETPSLFLVAFTGPPVKEDVLV